MSTPGASVSGSTLQCDRDAREIFNEAAIAHGTHDAELALVVCEKLTRIEPHYRLAPRSADDAQASATSGIRSRSAPETPAGKPIRIAAKFAGSCQKCGARHSAGDPIWWVRGARGVDCVGCGGASR